MKIGWLLDVNHLEYGNELIAAIRAQGHEAKTVQTLLPPYRWDDVQDSYRRLFPPEACVITYGDIELVERVRRQQLWHPGVFATVENFFCSSYYCHFGEHLLGREYVMLPFGELKRCRQFLFDTVGNNRRIFVRPDSPLKLFTGQVVGSETFDRDLEFMGFYGFSPSSLVVVNAPRTIEVEWRFVVAEQRVVTGSQYKKSDKNESQAVYDTGAKSLADAIAASNYQPDPVWVIDICRTDDGQYHLLEIGGFSFAGLYHCDLNAVVEAVSLAALDQWQRAQ